MSNRTTKGNSIVGNVLFNDGSVGLRCTAVVSVARTDITAKNLFLLPAGATPVALVVNGQVVSNAATTATLAIGKTGTNGFFVTSLDVKGATGAGAQYPAALNLGVTLAAATQVVGIYAETGAASSAGGPWVVSCLYRI